MKRVAALLVIVWMASVADAADPALLEKAKAEKKVTFYANVTAVEPILDAFAKTYGVTAEYTRVSTNKFVATVLTEHQAGKLMADVLQAPLPILEILKERGVLASYRPPAMAGYPAWAAKDERIQQFGIEYVAHIYNKDLVKPGRSPRSTKTWRTRNGAARSSWPTPPPMPPPSPG